MRILHRTKDYESKVFFVSRPDKANTDIERPMPSENIAGSFYSLDARSHDKVWPVRREEALKRFAHNVKPFVEPFGFIELMPEKAELKWLVATQEQEIAPEYARLAANGIEAFSMYMTYTDGDGEEHEIADDLPSTYVDEMGEEHDLAFETMDNLWTEAIAATLDSRIEDFLREADRRRWYSSRPKVAYEVVNDDDKRGLVAKSGHPWTTDELRAALPHAGTPAEVRAAMKRRTDPRWKAMRAKEGPAILLNPVEKAKAREFNRVLQWLGTLDEDAQREALLLMEQQEEASAEDDGYSPNEECEACENGYVYSEEYDDDVPCYICRATKRVSHTLGFDGIPAIEPEDEPQMRHEPASFSFVQRLTATAFRN